MDDAINLAYPPLPRTLVLGFGNKARAGKDWVARTLAHRIAGARILPFAAALKAYCRIGFGMREKNARLLQQMGTDVLRAKEPDIFVRTLYDTLAEDAVSWSDPIRVVLIPDVRFPNEAAMIKQMGGYVVRVKRLNADGTLYLATDRDPQHASEIALDDYPGWDHKIVALDGNLEHLKRQAITTYEVVERDWATVRRRPQQGQVASPS